MSAPVGVFGTVADGLPNVPSELLEPHLVSLICVAIQDLSFHDVCPGPEWFEDWSLRFQGVSYLLTGMNKRDYGSRAERRNPGPVHASMAWSHQTYKWTVAGGNRGEFGTRPEPDAYKTREMEEARQQLWSAAREARNQLHGREDD